MQHENAIQVIHARLAMPSFTCPVLLIKPVGITDYVPNTYLAIAKI